VLLQLETSTWIAVSLAVGAALLALVFSLVVSILLLRSRRIDGASDATALSVSNARIEVMMADLAGALELAQEESRRSRRLSGIRESLDLDAVLARTLDIAASLSGVDAAMIVLPKGSPGGGPKPLLASVGMSAEEAAAQPVEGPPDGRRARAVTIAYSYPADETAEEGLIRGGLAVPLASETDEPVGTLAVFWRSAPREASEEQMAQVEDLARSAGPAIENAYRFREARQLADLDALTNLHNRRYFHETLAREVARAQRYDRRLALVVLDIDDFKAINDRVGHLAGDTLLAEVGERVHSVVRGADVACRVGGDEFAVILPESTRADAEQLYRRLQLAVASKPAGAVDRLHLSAGIAELGPADDSVSFFERADEALYRAKEAGKGRAITSTNQPS
jgi:diguanylate cyclase (GGDEF)-like protein